MAELYSGAYEFGEPEEAAPVPRQQHQTLGDGPIESPARLEEEDDSPPVSPPPSPPGPLPVLYVRSERLQQLSRRLPVNADRPELLHGLVEAYGLLEGATVADPQPASAHQLLEFHSRPYLQALAAYEKLSERQRGQYGLEDDCAPFPGLYEHAALTAGGSLAAADGLCSGQHRLAVHLDGGRHHAHKDKAAGFCYVNDVVLAILALLCRFRRVLYVDVDVHHGDAVEEAFHMTHRVLTVSMHKHAPGFFPGSGATGTGGAGAGRGFALNLSLADGLRDDLFLAAFAELAGGAAAAFKPDCVVLQCGVDGLAHDPIAQAWALTPAAYAAAAAQAASWGAPLLLLGGGGYSSPAAACTWAAVLAALLGRQLPDDIPEHEQFERYGPAFTLSSVTRRLLPPDTNDRAAVLASCKQLVSELQAAVERTGGGGQAAAAGTAKRARQAAAGSPEPAPL
ncbi:hypothetical protein COHA_003503 [Chlorella ohadii]|uniref:histone deacetylase n=1 Tax=Chlorella ohadii TaxID=2649997 RepID=A0AAD5DUP6_9CHLO|nr:hypothetical protein COHA_003503 [Chlorella ohadii]